MSEQVLQDNLFELKELYENILKHVDRKTHHNIDYDRSRIMNGLNRKFSTRSALHSPYGRVNTHSAGLQRYSSNRSSMTHYRRDEGESSGLQTFGKLALGVAGAAAIIGGVAAMMNDDENDSNKKKERRQSPKEDECSIM
ncbi:unnamed protein product [Meganyctiphanes norvegica]|uniref:Uncharacterized protein n=1 Tax=Meganyctiphanes norvegica TaxID=48144 RepID=A0AAV2S1P4_MEGNR